MLPRNEFTITKLTDIKNLQEEELHERKEERLKVNKEKEDSK